MLGEFDLHFDDIFLNELSDSRILDMGKRAGFCEVPAEANEDLSWDVVYSGAWKRKRGAILGLEASTRAWSVRYVVRDSTCRDCKVLP